jgi:glycosyltransferase involved in cell wall biosynthesis
VIAFLTQDASPVDEMWLQRLIEPLDEISRIGLAFGPHRPRSDANPMIARELTEFFGSFSPDEEVRVDSALQLGDPATGFFSNVNSAILRKCWEGIRFRDLPYAEDQAFARDALNAGWRKAYVPRAAVLHSHDYSFMQFMRRYFDEYRGLREATGHIEPLRGRTLPNLIGQQVRRDLDFMRQSGWSRGRRLVGRIRSFRHHVGRYVFSVLGSRAHRLPRGARTALSLERRGDAPGDNALEAPIGRRIHASRHWRYKEIAEYYEQGHVPLTSPRRSERTSLDVAWIVPPFATGSGGHASVFRIACELEARGHTCSIWVHDPERSSPPERRLRELIRESFAPLTGEVHVGFERWTGTEIAVATGWQTAFPLARLPGCEVKAYLVQDYEPDFYPPSARRIWAEETYRMGFPCLVASPWLAETLRGPFGLVCEEFDFGVDLEVYHPREVQRAVDTVAFYARSATPRRGTELGLMALAEVVRRRPETRIIVFGDARASEAPFDYEYLGIQSPRQLSLLYSESTVGLVVSLSNYSLVPKEMMGCGLPVVDIRHPSAESVFGRETGVISLAEPDPHSIALHVMSLLENTGLRERQVQAASEFVRDLTWARAAQQIERSITAWLAARRGEQAHDPQRRPIRRTAR